MKSLILLSSLILSTSILAETVTVDVPRGENVVEISSTTRRSGCGNQNQFLDVVQADALEYVAGLNKAVKQEGNVWRNVMPKINPPPRYTCTAMVKYSQTVKFVHFANQDETITVKPPQNMKRNIEKKVFPVQYAH